MPASSNFSSAYIDATSAAKPSRPTPADAFRKAQATWLAGERVDIAALAASVGVSRPTIYKWCGDRDQLITDIVWSVTEPAMDAIWTSTDDAGLGGPDRLIEFQERFVALIASAEPVQAYVRNETHAALRLLTTRGAFQNRLVDKITELLQEETERGRLVLRADPHIVAFTLVRVTESFLYNEAIATLEARPEEAAVMTRLILT